MRFLILSISILTIMVSLFFSAFPAQAQVNTERFRGQMDEDGHRGSVELHFSNRTGNSDLQSGGAALNLGWRNGLNRTFFIGRADVGTTRSSTTINRGFAHLRYNRELSPRLVWELFVQREYDKFARLDARTLLGSGPRWALWLGKTFTAHFGVAYMAEREEIDVAVGAGDDPSGRFHRVSSHLSLSVKAGKWVTLSNVIYVQPRWREGRDTRVLNELSARFSTGGPLSLKITLVVRRDGAPPTGVKPLDTHLSNRLVWDF